MDVDLLHMDDIIPLMSSTVEKPSFTNWLNEQQQQSGIEVDDPIVEKFTKLCSEAGFSAYFIRKVSPDARMAATISVGHDNESILWGVPDKNISVIIIPKQNGEFYEIIAKAKAAGIWTKNEDETHILLGELVGDIPIDHISIITDKGESIASTGTCL
jgi:hypothetical protein